MKTEFAFIMLFIIGLTNFAGACPANPNITQSINVGGKEMQVRLWGDEFANGYETLDGYSIIKENGDWYYAVQDTEGKLAPTTPDAPISNRIGSRYFAW